MTSLNPSYTAGDQIMEALQLHQAMDKTAAKAEMWRLLDVVRIPDAKAASVRYPHQLSGGMRQRIMIAMALSCRPQVLIADEPTTALDVTIQAQILQLIRQLQEDMQMGVIFIIHDMGVVAEVADRVMVMYKGEKVEENTSEALFAAPKHRYTQALFSAVPRLGSMSHTDNPMPFALVRIQPAASAAVHESTKTVSNNVMAGSATTASSGQSSTDKVPAPSTARYDQSPVLQVKDLVTRFDVRSGVFGRVSHRVHAVERVSFDLYPGETLAIVGESGCGKTTTGRSLAQLEVPQDGRVFFHGQDMMALSATQRQAWHRQIQFIFQDPFGSLDPRMTVGDSIMEPLLIHDVCKGREAKERVRELMVKCGLTPEMTDRYPHEFSGGQRQRISIARALALSPQVIIADESVSALDVSIQAQIVNLLLDLQRDLGVSILFISHDMAVVERISHRVMVMYMGQVVEKGPRRAIFEQPRHPYTRALMAAVPIADPASRHRKRPLMVTEVPSVIRRVGDVPDVQPLVEVGPGHFLARHSIGAY